MDFKYSCRYFQKHFISSERRPLKICYNIHIGLICMKSFGCFILNGFISSHLSKHLSRNHSLDKMIVLKPCFFKELNFQNGISLQGTRYRLQSILRKVWKKKKSKEELLSKPKIRPHNPKDSSDASAGAATFGKLHIPTTRGPIHLQKTTLSTQLSAKKLQGKGNNCIKENYKYHFKFVSSRRREESTKFPLF